MHVKFEVCSFNRFGDISILRPKIYGSRDTTTSPFEKFLRVHVYWLKGLKLRTSKFDSHVPMNSLGTWLSNLKSVALTVLELLAFNAHAPF